MDILPQVQRDDFDYFQILILVFIVVLFYLGTKANSALTKAPKLSLTENIGFSVVSFLFLAFPFCEIVYQAFQNSMDLFVWVGAMLPPVTAGFTAKTQMTKLLEGAHAPS